MLVTSHAATIFERDKTGCATLEIYDPVFARRICIIGNTKFPQRSFLFVLTHESLKKKKNIKETFIFQLFTLSTQINCYQSRFDSMLSSLNVLPQIDTIILSLNPCTSVNEEAHHSIAINEITTTPLLLFSRSYEPKKLLGIINASLPLYESNTGSNVNEKRSLSEYGGGRLI